MHVLSNLCILLSLILCIPLTGQENTLYPLPSGPEGPGPFGAFYAHLEYDPAWDKNWRVAAHPHVVVRFDDGGHRFVFWRGTSFIPCWVTENGIWYTNEFVERRGIHSPNTNSMVEPMSDKQCRYSHVRIIESNPARVVVHWRYAPVDVEYQQAFLDMETGWGDWVDEYYTIYPDASGVRSITVQSSGLQKWVEFQESIVVNPPGTLPDDNIEPGAVSVANMEGEQVTYYWDEDGGPAFDKNPPLANILKINLKSKRQPYALVAPPKEFDNLFASYRGHGRHSIFNWWDHWPVSQDASDGRGARTADKPSHSSLCHIALPKDPPVDCWGTYGYANVIRNNALEWTLTQWGGLNIDMDKEVKVTQPITLSFDYAELWTSEVTFELYGPDGTFEDIALDASQLKTNQQEWYSFEQTLDLSAWSDEIDSKAPRIAEFYLEVTGNSAPQTLRLDNLQLRFANGTPIYQQDFDQPDGTIIEELDLPDRAQWEPYRVEAQKVTKLMLHGLTEKAIQDLVPLAESWVHPPMLRVEGKGFESQGYDPTQMAYVIKQNSVSGTDQLTLNLQASEASPLVNPAFVLKNWGKKEVSLSLNGQSLEAGESFRLGKEIRLEGTDQIIWLPLATKEPIQLTISKKPN